MSRKQKTLVYLGFLITAGSMVLSSVFINQSNDRSTELRKGIACLEDAREFGRANLLESSKFILFASTLYSLSELLGKAGNFDKTQAVLVQHFGDSVANALELEHEAVAAFQEAATCAENDHTGTIEVTPGTAACDALLGDQLVTDFRVEYDQLAQATGQQKQQRYRRLLDIYGDLRKADATCRNEWLKGDRAKRAEISALSMQINEEADRATLLGHIGTTLSILGLMVVLARDVLG